MRLDEISTKKLADYKTAAGKDATEADKAGDTKKADKRFSGIVKATKKQFDNDKKKSKVDEERHIQPARKMPSVGFKGAFDHVKQAITNASIDAPPYNTPEFRIDRVNEAIRALERIRDMLMSDSAISKASRK